LDKLAARRKNPHQQKMITNSLIFQN